MLTLKKKGNRYYREDRFGMRSFPIKKTEAEKLLAEGKAELVDKFIFDYTYNDIAEEQKEKSNVLSITERIEARKEKEQTEEAIQKFKNEYLPNLTKEDLQTILNSGENFGQEIVKICWRIDLEKKLDNQ